MNYKQAVEWLHSLGRVTDKPGPERMQALMAALGDPQRRLHFVHIAGTNGKGSATVMVASILKEAGYTVGANISPFVADFRERLQVNGEYASEEAVADALTRVRAAAESLESPTIEFMAVTAAAFLLFADAGCDIVCLEAGIGGASDDTNVIENTLVACMMHIGLDHTELLGETVEEITMEKCGIFKEGCEVVSYPDQPTGAMTLIRHRADKLGCPLTVPNLEDFQFYVARPFENRCNYGGYDLVVPFPGVHQCLNASVAVETALALWRKGYAIEDEHIIKGIEKAKLPARIEVLSHTPLVIVDGAHNGDSAEALARTLKMERVNNLTAVMGVLRDKDIRDMVKTLSPYIKRIYTVTPPSPRAMPAEELAGIAGNYVGEVAACGSLASAIAKAKAADGNGVLVCGSFYLAGEARELWQREAE